MNSVSVNEVVRRYHVVQSQRDCKERLDDLTENLIREYLEVALDNIGCKSSDILCIRNLHIPISFEPDKTDFEIFSIWIKDLEIALTQLFAKGHLRQWLRYPSVIEAVMSVARCISKKRLDNQWAWQQMGIIPNGQLSLSEAKDHWMAYLSRHTEYVPAVLNGIKKDNTIYDLVVADVFDSKDMRDLLLLNFSAYDICVDWQKIYNDLSKSLSGAVPLPSASEAQLLATMNMLTMSFEALFNGYKLSSFIAKIFQTPKDPKSTNQDQIEKLQLFYALIVMSKSSELTLIAASQQRIEGQIIAWLNHCRLWFASKPDTYEDNSVEAKSVKPEATEVKSNIEDMQTRYDDAANQPSNLIGYFGGVLFLLNLLKENNWHHSLMSLIDHHQSKTAVLEQLAMFLLPEIEQDAVLSVFTGAIFEESNQAPSTDRIDQEQLTQLSSFADLIKIEIVKRLNGNASDQINTIFTQMSRKKVKIEFAPGWVNVFYSLDDADTQVRASGLDINPGLIPWLGYMVSFYYE